MALLRQRKLVCFYCGRRSAKVQDGTVRRWECKECEAVNYLDENGQITDPPVTETQTGLSYSPAVDHALKKPTSDEGPFCATCIKNQHLLTTTLADYLPAPTHPDYAKYEASYPAYVAGLEKRYPQVCADCEPRARERIRAAGYVARTDHLRRMMERTKKSGIQRTWYQCGWRGFIVLLGGLIWWGSILGQSTWHFLGVMTWQASGELLDSDVKNGIIIYCLRRGLTGHLVDGRCVSDTSPLLWGAIILGVSSVWWNNQLMKKLRGSGFRLKGLNEYYKLQVVLLAIRILATWIPQDGSAWGLELSVSALRGAHAFMIMFLVLSTIISLRTVSVDRGPRISFPEADRPLTADASANQSAAKKQTVVPTNQSGLHSRPAPASINQYSGNQPFSIDKLARGFNSPGRHVGTTYQSPTPPPEEDDNYNDPDAMEWTPTQATFNPSHRVNAAEVTASFPVPPFSSFQRLPPAPKAPAAKLRTAAQTNKPYFKSHSEQLQSFFKTLTTSPSNEGGQEAKKSQKNNMVISPPQFFPEADGSGSTGLESLFDAAFSIRDEPVEVHETIEERTRPSSSSSSQIPHQRQSSAAAAQYTNILSIILRILALFTWSFSTKNPFKLSAIGISMISTLLAAAAMPGGTPLSSYSIYIHTLSSMLLTTIITRYSHIIPNHHLDLGGTILFSLMLAQNVRWLIISIKSHHHHHHLLLHQDGDPARRGAEHENPSSSTTASTPSIRSRILTPTTTTYASSSSSLSSSHYPPSSSTYTCPPGGNPSSSSSSTWLTTSTLTSTTNNNKKPSSATKSPFLSSKPKHPSYTSSLRSGWHIDSDDDDDDDL